MAWGAVAKARDMKKHYPIVAKKGPNTEKAQLAVDSSKRGSSQFDSNVDSLVGASRFSHIGSLKASAVSGSVLGQSSITAGSTNLSASVIAENAKRLSADTLTLGESQRSSLTRSSDWKHDSLGERPMARSDSQDVKTDRLQLSQ